MSNLDTSEIKCGCCHCNKDEEHGHNHNEHNHNHDDGINVEGILLAVSAVITVAATILHLFWDFNPIAIGIGCGIATLIAGYETFIDGIKSIIKLKIDETTLMTIAVIAAFCLGEFTEGALVTVLFQFGEFLEDFAVKRSRKSIESLAEIRPDTGTIITENGEKVVNAEDIPIGSIILVKPHERIPVDGVIIEGNSSIDTSAITGESLPIEGTPDTEVMSGMQNGNGVIKVRTTKSAENSTAARILKMVEESQKNKGEREKFISKFAKIYTPIIIVISVLVAVVPTIVLGNFSIWLYRALVCLVASCPCAIVISVPLAYFAGIGGASKKGAMIKGGKYIEALAKADTFVFDKTGTLTTGKIQVCDITTFGSLTEEEIILYSATAEQYSSHPIAQAIIEKAEQMQIKIKNADSCAEKAGYGVTAIVDNKEVTVGNIKLISEEDKILIKNNASVFLLIDNKLQGAISITDTVRKETKEVLSQLKNLGGKNLVMLTGDNEEKAKVIAKETGITTYHSNLLPAEKVKHMEELKKSSTKTVFVGDGINDAPVIALADCGVAMGLGSDAAIEASDAVLSDGTLKQLPAMVRRTKRIMNTIKTNITFALLVKTVVIALGILGFAPMWLGVLADTGVSMLCILYSIRLIK